MNELTLSNSNLRVLAVLLSSIKEHNLHSLASSTGLSVMGISKIIRQLEKKQIVTITKIGKSYLIRPNQSPKNILFFSLAERHKFQEFLQKHSALKGFLTQLREKLAEKAEFALIFGSYASGEEGTNSDLDLLVVSSKKKEIAKAIKTLSVILEVDLSPIIVSPEEFISQSRKKHRLYQEIINGKRVIIAGEYEFWKRVLSF